MIKETPKFAYENDSNLPFWVQLRDYIAGLINSGYYKPGDKLPTVRKYAADLNIAYNTVSKAYMGLERDGYVTTVRGSGVFVNDLTGLAQDCGQLELLAEEFVRQCIKERLTYDDTAKLMLTTIRRMKKSHEN